MTLSDQLLNYVRTELAGGTDPAAIDENASLIDSGIIDSMALMQLIGFIEERFGVRVPDSEVVPDNFDTITGIESLVQRLRTR